jgi:hypothetical protein
MRKLRITKKRLERLAVKVTAIIDEIDSIGENCSISDGESELGENLWSAQRSLDEARTTLREEV